MEIFLYIIGIILILLSITYVVLFIINLISPKTCNKELSVKDKNTYVKYNKENKTLIKYNIDNSVSNLPIRVLSCTDTHFQTGEYVFGFEVLKRLIDKTNPDLVILNGDNVCNRVDDSIQKDLISYFENKKIYYTFTLGNHDSERMIKEELNGKELNEDLYKEIRRDKRLIMFNSLSNNEYCLSFNTLDIEGVGNHYIHLSDDNGIYRSIYLFDSQDYIYGRLRKTIGSEKRVYDHIRESQLNWYVNETSKYNVNSMAFFHIPLKEHYKAYINQLFKLGFNKEYGNNYEKPCYSRDKDNTFDIFKNHGTDIVVCGHDHKNDSIIKYKGIKLMYSQGLSFDGSYNRRKKNKWMIPLNKINKSMYTEGVTIFDIDRNEVNITPIYAEKEGCFMGLEKYFKRAFIKNE